MLKAFMIVLIVLNVFSVFLQGYYFMTFGGGRFALVALFNLFAAWYLFHTIPRSSH